MTRLRFDDAAALDVLTRQGLTPDARPSSGQTVILRATANLIARRAAGVIGLDFADIDEDTALLVERCAGRVIGSGAVHMGDGEAATHSNIAEAKADRALSIFDVKTHVLSSGDRFDFEARRPACGSDTPQTVQES
ncbi:hypothetical protein [uncultured Brevundimonas sp.]|uniref:hypothetical protein n=1 Tax=uncultured Brevundimonas sp. TaxID=213418 RepID=UPI0025F1EBA8|nr:hypothetical protein [uncultured Brevundimonas sp.]